MCFAMYLCFYVVPFDNILSAPTNPGFDINHCAVVSKIIRFLDARYLLTWPGKIFLPEL